MRLTDIFGAPKPLQRKRKPRELPAPQVPREMLLSRAHAFEGLVDLPAWQYVLDLMEERLDRAEADMLMAKASDPMELLGLQRRARAYREMFDGIQQDIQRAIQLAREESE